MTTNDCQAVSISIPKLTPEEIAKLKEKKSGAESINSEARVPVGKPISETGESSGTHAQNDSKTTNPLLFGPRIPQESGLEDRLTEVTVPEETETQAGIMGGFWGLNWFNFTPASSTTTTQEATSVSGTKTPKETTTTTTTGASQNNKSVEAPTKEELAKLQAQVDAGIPLTEEQSIKLEQQYSMALKNDEEMKTIKKAMSFVATCKDASDFESEEFNKLDEETKTYIKTVLSNVTSGKTKVTPSESAKRSVEAGRLVE